MTPPPQPGAHPPAPTPDELRSPAGELLERSAAATALADLAGRITYVNPAFLELWGFEHADAVLGRDAAEDFWVEPDRAREVIRALGSQPVWQGEMMARLPGGRSMPMRVTAQMLMDRQGRPQGLLGNFVDIGAEHAMRAAWESERRFADWLVEGAGVLVAALDEQGRFLRFNRECERVSGWAAEDVIGRSPWETVLPAEIADVVRDEAFAASMANAEPGRITRYTNEWVSRSGRRTLIEWTNRVMVEADGHRRLMICIGSDVTAREAARQALTRSEAQLRTAQAIARMGSWELDISTGRLEWSDAVFELFEMDRPEFQASYQAFLEAIHPDDRDRVDEAYLRSLRDRQPYLIEHRLRMPDGRVKWVEERCATEFDAEGRPLRSRGTIQDVTDRHKRELELTRFRLMVEHAPVEIWLTDDSSRIAYANAAACESLGHAPDALNGMLLADIDVGGASSVKTIRDAVEGHRLSESRPEVFRVWHRAADGRVVPKEMYATTRDFDGRSYGISFAHDISERHRTEQTLAASEALLRDVLDAYPGWVSCVDEAMRYVYVSPRFEWRVGRPASEIIGRTPDEVLGPKGSAERWAVHRRLLAGAASAQAERRFIDPEGRERTSWVEYRTSVGAGPEARRLFYAFASDITDLRQAERRIAAVTQDLGVGMWEFSPKTGTVDFNDELLALVGFERADVTGDPLAFLVDLIEPADRPSRRATANELIEGRLAKAQVQMRMRHKQGHVVWVQESLRAAGPDDSRRPTSIIGVAQDISALKAREADLEKVATELEVRVARRTHALELARAEAERANAAKSEFLSQMSHELRTPLNAIIGFGQLLEMSHLEQEDAEHVQEVMRAGRHLLQLIDEVLDLATVEAGRVPLRIGPVQLAPLVADCLRLVGPEVQRAGIVLAAPELPADATVLADARRLRQVLLNLLSNAIKYNRRGGSVRLTVEACAVDESAAWRLSVTDTGPGLTQAQVGRLFQPFERLGAERSAIKGSGIGLSLSRRLAELMGGTLSVESWPGRGSTFSLCLPAGDHGSASLEGPLQAGVSGSAAPGEPSAVRHRVLYVEDNEANQRLVQRFLTRRDDIDLLVAPSVAEGLSLACAWLPDLLLVDIQLPDGDGHDLLSELRRRGVSAPAVAVSANAMPGDVARGQAAGFVAYLTKPLDLRELSMLVDAHLPGP